VTSGRPERTRASPCALWPDFPEANVLYGTILYMLAEDDLAKQLLSHAQELRPDDEMVRRLLGELRAR
jgi:hypothetical protein